MKDTLDLVGDGDDVDVIQDVERAFGIKLTDAEAERLLTVGQLHDLIEFKRPGAGGRTLACLSQVAFYRLRQGLAHMEIEDEITPQTPISVLEGIEPQSISLKWRRLAQSSGLDLPPLETPFHSWVPERWRYSSWPSGIVIGMLGCVGAAAAIFFDSPVVVLLSGFVAIPALGIGIDYVWWLVFRTVPRRLVTIGDLAREAAGCSFAKLATEKKGCGPSDRWFALTAILRDITGHKTAITRETTFLPKKRNPQRSIR